VQAAMTMSNGLRFHATRPRALLINHWTRYTALTPNRFKNFWKD
jgi:hypothetical protein